MAKFDVHRMRDSDAYVIDCQSDLIDQFTTRLVVPLIPREEITRPFPRLMPVFTVESREMIMATHLAAAVPKRELGPAILSLAGHDMQIGAALDLLITGV